MTVWAWDSYYHTTTKPSPTPAALAAIPLVIAADDAGEDFGACHIVLADLNFDDDHINFCLALPYITPEGIAAMTALLAMTKQERAIALCLANGEQFSAWTDEEWAKFDRDDDD